MRQIGHGHQHGLQLGLDLVQARGRLFQLGLHGGHFGLGGFGGVLFALAHQHADLLGQLVALGLQLLRARLDGLAFGFQRLEGFHVQEGLGVLAGLQSGDD